jgi:hypothetical protein
MCECANQKAGICKLFFIRTLAHLNNELFKQNK